MITFECLMEIYKNNKVQYIVITFQSGGDSIPTQDNMQDRDDIVEKAIVAYPEHEILDLIGVVQEGKVVWQDGSRQ